MEKDHFRKKSRKWIGMEYRRGKKNFQQEYVERQQTRLRRFQPHDNYLGKKWQMKNILARQMGEGETKFKTTFVDLWGVEGRLIVGAIQRTLLGLRNGRDEPMF